MVARYPARPTAYAPCRLVASAVVLEALTTFSQFAIGFDPRDRDRLHRLWDEVIDSQQWSHGEMTRRFEAAWAAWNGVPAVAFASWAGGALAALDYAGVAGGKGPVPADTFMAPPPPTPP